MLGFVRGSRGYSWVMAVAIVLSLVRGAWPLFDTVIFWSVEDFWEGLGLYIYVTICIELIFLPTMVLLSLSMAWLCDDASLPRAAGSWRTTRNLFLFLNAAPLGLYYIALLLGLLPKLPDVRIFYTTWFAIVVMVVTNLPLIYFYDSTSRMPG